MTSRVPAALFIVFTIAEVCMGCNPSGCLSRSDMVETWECFDNCLMGTDYILNYERYLLTLASPTELSDWTGLIDSMLTNAKNNQNCPDIPSSLQSSFACSVWNNKYLILYETSTSNCRRIENGVCTETGTTEFEKGWGIFIAAKENHIDADVHVSAPHPKNDQYTSRQASYVFEHANCRSLSLSGMRRYAYKNYTANPCQGNRPGTDYYPTDPAHNDETTMHHTLMTTYDWQTDPNKGGGCPHSNCAFIQYHGMGTSTCPGDDVFMSIGCDRNTNAITATMPISLIEDQVKIKAPDWSVHTPDSSDCKLRAMSNVFGRYINGVPKSSVCNTDADPSQATGHFVHVEQIKTIRESVDNRAIWADIVDTAL